jgi:hypothetical protein
MSKVCFRTEEKQQLASATIYIWSKVYQSVHQFFLKNPNMCIYGNWMGIV